MDTYISQFHWKNFDLNNELHIAGSFIYDGISLIDKISQLRFEDEYFQLLYYISVGIERLEKIAYLLLSHKSGDKNPSTKWRMHDHTKLYELINLHTELLLENKEFAFLELLRDFYSLGRYDRFNYSSTKFTSNKDKELLIDFLSKYLNITPQNFFGNERILFLSQEIKVEIGNLIRGIIMPLYNLINDTASELRLYTYEIRYNSKAFKIFIEKEYSFIKEHIAQREILIKLFNSPWESNEFIEKIRQIQPLDIDEVTTDMYLGYLMNFSKFPEVKDEVTQLYEDENLEDRDSQINFIGEEYFFTDGEEDEYFI